MSILDRIDPEDPYAHLLCTDPRCTAYHPVWEAVDRIVFVEHHPEKETDDEF